MKLILESETGEYNGLGRIEVSDDSLASHNFICEGDYDSIRTKTKKLFDILIKAKKDCEKVLEEE